MMKQLLAFALIIASHIPSSAQKYWQQHVSTTIQVTLDDNNDMLSGSEQLVYTNNSPDTLSFLYIHLWPNAYKNDRTQFCEQQIENGNTDFYYSSSEERGYIDSLSFRINDIPVLHSLLPDQIDIARITLPTALYPGEKITIATPFKVKLPKVFSRLGHSGQAYYISQWFPKPAVYDRKGWHPLSYLDQGEFYSEFGDYDVSITLPKNYIVMATGNCMNEAENAWLDSLSSTSQTTSDSFPESDATYKTIRFKEDNIHDFAWFADKRWIVKKDTAINPTDSSKVITYIAYLPSQSKSWQKGNLYLKETITNYGKEVGKYPYKTIKAVEGDMPAGGGMEYPTVTIVDRAATSSLKTVIVHEAGHNWFYGILGTNERQHPWMDEGINSFYEAKTIAAIQTAKDSIDGKPAPPKTSLEEVLVMQLAAVAKDQPIEQPATAFANLNYGLDIYTKTKMYLYWLEDYVGADTFRTAMHSYYDQWKFRHPYPEDFRKILELHTAKDVSWFFDGLLSNDRRIDFKLKATHFENGVLSVSLRNKSGFAAPIRLDVYDNDSLVSQCWTTPFASDTNILIPGIAAYTRINIGAKVADYKMANNSYRPTGLMRHGGFAIKPAIGYNNKYTENAWLLPALGYNKYDGLMLGGLIHNITLPQPSFRFIVSPIYAFASKDFVFAGSVGKFFYPNSGIVREVYGQLNGKSFHFDKTTTNTPNPLFTRFIKLSPEIGINFREADSRSKVSRTLALKGYYIKEEQFDFVLNPADSMYFPQIASSSHFYGRLNYSHKNARAINPFSYTGDIQAGKEFVKMSIEGKLRIDYNMAGKALRVRAFAGKYFDIGNNPYNDRYYLNTTYTGINDYLYENTFLGRTEQSGFFSRQIAISEGGFKVPTILYSSPIGRSNDWLAAINIETDIPLNKIPLRFFLDIGSFADAATLTPGGNKLLYEGGISLHLAKNLLSIYVPLVVSTDFNDYLKSMYPTNKLLNSVVFTLNINQINWLKLPDRLSSYL